MTKKLVKLSSVFIALLLLVTCTGCKAKPQTFTKLEMSIDLTNKFAEKNHISYTSYYESKDMLVVTLREPFTMMSGSESWSVRQYANACINANVLSGTTIHNSENGNYVYFEFEKTLNGQSYSYLATCHKADEAFWLIQLAAYSNNYNKLRDDLFGFANTIRFE